MADGANSEELSSFCDQIALMLSSGMTLRDGIEMLAEDEMKANDKSKPHPYTNLYKVVDETGSLYVAMKENEEDWPSYMIEWKTSWSASRHTISGRAGSGPPRSAPSLIRWCWA